MGYADKELGTTPFPNPTVNEELKETRWQDDTV